MCKNNDYVNSIEVIMKKYKIFLLMFLVAFSCSKEEDTSIEEDISKEEDVSLFLADRTLNIAHRGGRTSTPEETIEAYDNALNVGADVLEMDVHSSSDGVIVLMHDDTVNRTTDGDGNINDMTFDELQNLDAGYNFTADDGDTYPYRGKGVKIASLREIFEKYSDEYLLIEIKQGNPSIVDDFLLLVDEYDMVEKIVVASFAQLTIDELREKNHNLQTGMGPIEMAQFASLSLENEGSYIPPSGFMQPPYDSVDVSFIEKAERFALIVHVWTVNSEVDMKDMINIGVHGIMTDDPELLGTLL